MVRENIRFFLSRCEMGKKKVSMNICIICTLLPSCLSTILLFEKYGSVLRVHRVKHEIILSIVTKYCAFSVR